MNIDRRAFIEGLGGSAAIALMSDEAKADALEHHLLSQPAAVAKFPTAAQVEAQIDTKPTRKGVGNLFVARQGNVARLTPLPPQPTLADYFKLRFTATANHCLQSANRAMKNGMSEEIVLACLLHDTVQELIKVDHGWWSAQMYEPYVSAKVAFAIRYHQALRFYEDKSAGYEYPDLYRRIYGSDYRPEPYIERTYQMVRKHKWYLEPRMVTVNDLYAFEPNVNPVLEQFTDIIGRHFRQPAAGLGFDDSPSAHMWRSLSMPDHPL
ncbi:MAG TPA: hypothetical protein VGM97_12135 [Steroidobacteraceae bacterium]|jgi:hypothetical protein